MSKHKIKFYIKSSTITICLNILEKYGKQKKKPYCANTEVNSYSCSLIFQKYVILRAISTRRRKIVVCIRLSKYVRKATDRKHECYIYLRALSIFVFTYK